eukprot:jgi/Botrbrau1/22549/Bobra.114_2s0072.1
MDVWDNFATVDIDVSGVVPAPPHAVWAHLSTFGDMGQYMAPVNGHCVRTTLMAGNYERQIGARRLLQVGPGRLVEELTALDHENQTLTFKLVSDSKNINPFPASFLNHRCTVKQRAVTTTGETFVEISGRFMTEHPMVDIMEETWECLYESIIHGLAERLGAAPQYAGRGGHGGPGMKGAARDSASAFAAQESPEAEPVGVYTHGRRSYDLPPLGSYHMGDAPPRNTRSVDFSRGHPSAQQSDMLDCMQRPLSFPVGAPQISVVGHMGSVQSAVQSTHLAYGTGSVCSSTEWQGTGAGMPDMSGMCLKDRMLSPAQARQAECEARAACRDACEPGVQTPPQKVEARFGACRVGTASSNGSASRPAVLSHQAAVSRRQSKPVQQHGMGHPMGFTAKPLISADHFVSPFASLSMNRASSSSSFGVPTPDKGGSRRTSFE